MAKVLCTPISDQGGRIPMEHNAKNKTKQNKTKQNKTKKQKQNKTKQRITKLDTYQHYSKTLNIIERKKLVRFWK